MGRFCGTVGAYCICQLLNTKILLLHMFIRGLLLNNISEVHRILELSTYNTNLLLNFNEFFSILVQKV